MIFKQIRRGVSEPVRLKTKRITKIRNKFKISILCPEPPTS